MADSSPLRPPPSLFVNKLCSPSSSPSLPRALNGVNIKDCLVDSVEVITPTVPVAIRIFYNPSKNTALFRLSASVYLEQTHIQDAAIHRDTDTAAGVGITEGISECRRPADKPQSQPTTFYLEIRPEHVHSLSVLQDAFLHFTLKQPRAISLIAPCSVPPLHVSTAPDELVTLGRLAMCSTITVRLPCQGPSAGLFQRSRSALVALSRALDCDARIEDYVALHPDVETVDRRCLYLGGGGRVVDVDLELLLPASPPAFPFPPGTPEQPSRPATPTEPASSDGPGFAPPAYWNTPVACNPPSTVPLSPTPHQKKRQRIYSPSTPSSTCSNIEPTKVYTETQCGQELANEEKAKQMTELLQRGAEQEERLRILLQELEKKNAAIDKKYAKMGRVYQKMKALLDAATQDEHSSASTQSAPASPSRSQISITSAEAAPVSPSQSQVSTASAQSVPASPCLSSVSTASVASPAIDVTAESPSAEVGSGPPTPPGPRLRRYIDWKVRSLRRKIDAHEYATELYVREELDKKMISWDEEVVGFISEEVEKEVDRKADEIEQGVREKIVERLSAD